MKRLLLLTILYFLTLGCSTSNSELNQIPETAFFERTSSEITFQVKVSNQDDLEIFEDGVIPWISIDRPEKSLKNLINKDEIVIRSNKAILLIDYPLNKPVKIEIKSQNSNGFSRANLIKLISEEYKRIYQEEEESTKTKTVPLEEREGLINRNQTNGIYGIWGHDIDDLDLSRIIVHQEKNNIPILELYIES